jgi:hypothetical protein
MQHNNTNVNEIDEMVTESSSNEQMHNQNIIQRNKVMRKIGRTLLVKSFNTTDIDESLFENLEGLEKVAKTKHSNTVFLLFNTSEKALSGLRNLKTKSQNIRTKFSYYKLFFTITGLNDSVEYNDVKKSLINFVSNNTKTKGDVLYCKFYRKNKKYLGCGELTVDTLDTMLELLSKEAGFKEFSFTNSLDNLTVASSSNSTTVSNTFTGTFYKFNDKKKL